MSRDSAGVEIVESHGASWRNSDAWTVSEDPALEIGVLQGADHFMFDRVAGVLALKDAMVVANGGTGEVRFFDRAGGFLRSVGGEGEGPGEYRAIERIGRWGNDSIYLYDPRLNRVSVLDQEGDFARSFSASSSEMRVRDVQPLTNGDWIGQDGSTLKPGAPGTVSRDTAHFYLVTPSEGVLDTIAAVPAERTFTFSMQGQEGYRYAPLTPSPTWAVRGDQLYVTSGEDFQLQVVGRDGEVDRIIRRSAAPAEVTEDDMAAWRESLLTAVPDPARPQFRSLLSEFPSPTHLPVYRKLLLESSGHVWLERHRSHGEPSGSWEVFDPDGRYLGEVEVMPGFEVFDVAEDRLWGVWTDESGMEMVRVYTIHRSSGLER